MKTHFCPVERTMIDFEGECNWCDEKENVLTKDEALKMAIEALEKSLNSIEEETIDSIYVRQSIGYAIQACKEALAQPAQEPVAWIDEFGNCEFTYAMWMKEEPNVTWIPVYTHPAPVQNEFAKTKSWQGLSNDRIREIGDNCHNGLFNWIDFARAIEAKLKEKNHG